MNEETSYVTTLEDYLQFSDEDQLDADYVFTQLSTLAHNFLAHWKAMKSITMLDVGAGNGIKALNLAKSLASEGISVRIDSIEPKADQRHYLRQNHAEENNIYLGEIHETTLDNAGIDQQYDIVIVFHSLYQFPRNSNNSISGLDKVYGLLKEEGAGIIVNEYSLQDSFQKMKHALYPSFGKQQPVSEKVIQQTLLQHDIPCRIGNAFEFKYWLGDISTKSNFDLGKDVDFLFSDALGSMPLSEEEYSQAGQWIRAQAKYDDTYNKYYLQNWHVIVWFSHSSSPTLILESSTKERSLKDSS